MKKLRGAVVGVGYLGHFHAQKMKALSAELDFDFVGIFDINAEARELRAKELQVKAFSSLVAMIDEVDLVTIATSTPSHFEMAKFFLGHGKHVNVEKPICLELAQSLELQKLAESKNLVLTVGHSERFSKVFAELKTKILKPKYVELIRHAPFKARGSEVGVIFDLMIHDIDLLLSLDATPVKVLQSLGGNVDGAGQDGDWVQATFAFDSGLRAMISVSRLAPAMQRTLKVIGSERVVFGNFQTNEIEIGTATAQGFEFQKTAVDKSDNLLAENRNFIKSCLKLEEPLVPGRDGHRALMLCYEVRSRALSGQKP